MPTTQHRATKKRPRAAPWERPAPKKVARKRSTTLTPAQKAHAKKRAAKAGRPYPNLVDNMHEASTASDTPKKAATKRAATKRTTTKRAATKRAATKRTTTKRSATKRAATKRTTTKRAATKRAATKRSATKRTRR